MLVLSVAVAGGGVLTAGLACGIGITERSKWPLQRQRLRRIHIHGACQRGKAAPEPETGGFPAPHRPTSGDRPEHMTTDPLGCYEGDRLNIGPS